MSKTPVTESLNSPQKISELLRGVVDDRVLAEAKGAMENVVLANYQVGNTDASAKYAGTGVYYGASNREVMGAAGKYDHLVVEPGAFSRAPRNGIAYVPLSGLNKDNANHRTLFHEVMKVGGFLQDARGNYVEDPQGPGTYMIDWRNTKVQGVMADHIKNLVRRQGYDGVMFDAIDSVIGLENTDPQRFGALDDKGKGLTQSALVFAYNAGSFVKKQKPEAEIIINGGIASQYQGKDDFDVKRAIGMTADKMMVESQYSENGVPRDEEVFGLCKVIQSPDFADRSNGICNAINQMLGTNLTVQNISSQWQDLKQALDKKYPTLEANGKNKVEMLIKDITQRDESPLMEKYWEYSVDSRPWLVGQLTEVASHAKEEFSFAIVDPGWAPMNLQQATQVGKNALQFTKGVAEEVSQNVNASREDGKKVHIAGSVVITNDYTTPGMAVGNTAVAEKVNAVGSGSASRGR